MDDGVLVHMERKKPFPFWEEAKYAQWYSTGSDDSATGVPEILQNSHEYLLMRQHLLGIYAF